MTFTRNTLLATTASILLLGMADKASALSLKDIGNAIGDVVEGAVDVVEDVGEATLEATGIPTAVRVIEGDSLDDAVSEGLDNVKDGIRSAAGATTLIDPVRQIETQLIEEVAGEDAAKVHAVTKYPTRVLEGLPSALVEYGISTTENIDNAEDAIGIPLAAALHQAHAFFDDKAEPLPDPIKRMLAVHFDQASLDAARFVVDDQPDTLNGLINLLQTKIGDSTADNHAVVIGDIIVFAKMPALDITDIRFWAHEVAHTIQYAKLGLNGFAAEYVRNYEGIEDEAHHEADEMFSKLSEVLSAVTGAAAPDAG